MPLQVRSVGHLLARERSRQGPVALVGLHKAALALAGSLLLAVTAGALLFSVWFGLFGYRERFSAPCTSESLGVEVAGAAILAGAALLLGRRRGASSP